MTKADRIAAEIVELVERTNGPVTFLDIEREVHDFRKEEPPVWAFMLGANEEDVLWADMTKHGIAALHKVLDEQMVAIQYVNWLPYLAAEGFVLPYDNWRPAMLLPARAANLKTWRWLTRASPEYQKYAINQAAADGRPGYRRLTPAPLRFSADRFSV